MHAIFLFKSTLIEDRASATIFGIV